MRSGVATFLATFIIGASMGPAHAQAWRDCIPGSIAPGGCDSIAPGGGQSIAPGGGLSIGPGGGLSIAPGGGQSIAPGGGRSIAPGGGLAIDRDWSRGLDPDTLRPRPSPFGNTFSVPDSSTFIPQTSTPAVMGTLAGQIGQIFANRRAAKQVAPYYVQALQEGRCEDAMNLAIRFGTSSDQAMALECMSRRAASRGW